MTKEQDLYEFMGEVRANLKTAEKQNEILFDKMDELVSKVSKICGNCQKNNARIKAIEDWRTSFKEDRRVLLVAAVAVFGSALGVIQLFMG